MEKEIFNSDELDEIAADLGRVRSVFEIIEYMCDNTPPGSVEKIEALATITAHTVKQVSERLSEIAMIQYRAEKATVDKAS